MAEDALEVCKAVKNEEEFLQNNFEKKLYIRYPTEGYVSNLLEGRIEPNAKLTKSAYEVWCVLALINSTKPSKIIDPVSMKENSNFWLKAKHRKHPVNGWRLARDQIPTNIIWKAEDAPSETYSIKYQPHIGTTALTSEQRAWFKNETQGKVWDLKGYLKDDGVRLRPDILLYEKRVKNIVDFRDRRIPEIDFVINVEAKHGWSEKDDYAAAFRPKKGACIVSLHEEAPKLVSQTRIITADLDKNKLKKLLLDP